LILVDERIQGCNAVAGRLAVDWNLDDIEAVVGDLDVADFEE
jgi:hypothetical protein